jgi:hypothetical protein
MAAARLYRRPTGMPLHQRLVEPIPAGAIAKVINALNPAVVSVAVLDPVAPWVAFTPE